MLFSRVGHSHHSLLVILGLCAISGVTKLKDFVPYLYTVYPKDINELETFVEKNTAIEYYYNDEMIISKLTINK